MNSAIVIIINLFCHNNYLIRLNTKLLLSDINTKIRGRCLEIKVYLLSFKEYYENIGEDRKKINKYIMYGRVLYVSTLDNDYKKYFNKLNNKAYNNLK